MNFLSFLQELEKAIQEAERTKKEIDEKTSSADEELKEMSANFEKIQESITELEEQGKTHKKRAAELHQQEEELNRKVKREKHKMTVMHEQADRVVQAALLAHVKLPDVQDSRAAEDNQFDPDLPGVFQYNFSQLSSAQQKARNDSAKDAQMAKLQQTIEDASKALECMVPNFKAPEEYEQVVKEEKQLKTVWTYPYDAAPLSTNLSCCRLGMHFGQWLSVVLNTTRSCINATVLQDVGTTLSTAPTALFGV